MNRWARKVKRVGELSLERLVWSYGGFTTAPSSDESLYGDDHGSAIGRAFLLPLEGIRESI